MENRGLIPSLPQQNYLNHDLNLDMYRDLDCNLENVPVYTGHSLFNTTKHITLLFNVQSILYCNPPNIWIKFIQIAIKIECLQGTKYLDSDCNLDRNQVICSV